MKLFVFITLITTIFVSACAFTQQQRILAVERGLDAGNEALDLAVEIQIEKCRAKNLPSDEARELCVEPMMKANDVATPIIEAAVAALRAYWTAAAANDQSNMQRALLALRTAIDNLPDAYFAGLKPIVERLR